MRRFDEVTAPHRKVPLGVAGLLATWSLIIFCATCITQSSAVAQVQNAPSSAGAFRYEVVSIKPNNSNDRGNRQNAPDGFTETNVSLQILVLRAFGIQEFQLAGAPSWITSERFDIDAKMDTTVADAFQKLNPDDQRIARQQMLRAVLTDRFGMAFHREDRVFQVYALVIGKKGPKLHEAKPGDTYPNGIKYPNGGGGAGAIMMRMSPESQTLTAQAVPIASLMNQLRLASLGRPVLDKTGLTGKYDFTLTWAPENVAVTGVPGVATQSSIIPADPAAPSLFTALEEQLGLKLESVKASIEIIVVDHVDRPSGN